MGLSYIWTTIVVTALLIAIHRVPSLETDVSKDTQKLVPRLIGTPPMRPFFVILLDPIFGLLSHLLERAEELHVEHPSR